MPARRFSLACNFQFVGSLVVLGPIKTLDLFKKKIVVVYLIVYLIGTSSSGVLTNSYDRIFGYLKMTSCQSSFPALIPS